MKGVARGSLATLAVAALLSHDMARAQVCCNYPTSESTQAIQAYNYTLTMFKQTVADASNSSFDNYWVQEAVAQEGADTCWFPGSPYLPGTEISGGQWQVASADVGFAHNTWGYDYVGYLPEGVSYYQAQTPAHGGSLPCGASNYQEMQELCGSTWVPYTTLYGNLLTATIRLMNVTNCRNDMTNAACQTIFACGPACQ